MSVLVRGMKMPKDCRECPSNMYQVNTGRTICRATRKNLSDNYGIISFAGKHYGCPLVEVKDADSHD